MSADIEDGGGAMKLPEWFMDHLHAATGRRSRIVIEHILKYGHITTEELKEKYGYGHPPRAARDVREQGIPLETFQVRDGQGRRIAAYRFGDPQDAEPHKLGGRGTWPKDLKRNLVEASRSRCAICVTPYRDRELQIDHRVPYEVTGPATGGGMDPGEVMLLCGSCNRAKSWTCEHCENLTGARVADLCRDCYWGSPEAYSHAALRPIRRADVVWSGDEIEHHRVVSRLAAEANERVPTFIKRILRGVVAGEADGADGNGGG